MSYRDYLRLDKLPHTWCAGCGNGAVLGALARAFDELRLDPADIVVVTGIGCWGKADDYLNANAFHGSHGRALAFATGIKLANPDLTVAVLMGDGDGVTIGGNHFIHAARRNVDLAALVVNNLNYGMTGGQYSGTTPEHSITATSRHGHIEEGFDICRLAEAAGATYVARVASDNTPVVKKRLVEAIRHRGFALVEAITPCPTHYGRNNGMRTAMDMHRWIRENSLSVAKAADMKPEDLRGKFVMGNFVNRAGVDDYGAKYRKMVESLAEDDHA